MTAAHIGAAFHLISLVVLRVRLAHPREALACSLSSGLLSGEDIVTTVGMSQKWHNQTV
jgi:hypothetical protein